ncbi:MAG: hypothetical protein ACE5DI_03520 [Candidatus Micrarchaeia archaeon]
MARFEVDQSGKWEASGNTAIGVCGTKRFSLFVPFHVKQRVERTLKHYDQEKNRSKSTGHIRRFTYCLFMALRKIVRTGDRLIIDEEYQGQDRRIKTFLLYLFERFEKEKLNPRDIQFERIGKNSEAHAIARQTFLGLRKPDLEASDSDFFSLMDRTVEVRTKAYKKRMNKKNKKVWQ